MDGEIKNLMKVSLTLITSLTYCYFISSKIPKGKFRLLSILPIIFLFTILPLQLSYLFPRAIACLFISWLANFKLLLFAFNQGPLSFDYTIKSLPQFILITCLPIKIQQHNLSSNKKIENPFPQNSQKTHSKTPRLPLNWPTKVMIFAILVGLHDFTKVHMPLAMSLLYCCMAYLIVDIIFGPSSTIVHAVLRLELEPPSDELYFSTSLQDFWGRRWNLMITNVLRHTIYKPVRSSLGPMLDPWAPLPAVLAAFLVSGLMHELLFYYVTRASPTWEVTCFFVLHGLCLVVELALKRLLAGKFRLHSAISGLLTVGFVMGTAMWLFFPPVVRLGAADRAIEECKMLSHFVSKKFKLNSKFLSLSNSHGMDQIKDI